MSHPLQPEFDYYVEHQAELASRFEGKYVVIKNRQVIGVYPTELQAVRETSKVHPEGTFFVQKCERGEQNYTQSFHSRVAFA